MISWIDQNLALIIAGSILGLATFFIYSTGRNAFLSRGNFQSKTSATEIRSAEIYGIGVLLIVSDFLVF